MRRRLAQVLVAVFFVAGLGAAQGPNSSESGHSRKTTQQGAAKTGRKLPPKPYQVGTASWYGSYFVGKATASGEPYDMYDMTAAHPTLPLGTWVQVTNLQNGRRVILRINDRGPIVPGRIIDVSYGAAQALHFKSRGLQRVRLDVVEPRIIAEYRPPVAY